VENNSSQALFQLRFLLTPEEDVDTITGYALQGAHMVRLTSFVLASLILTACGMGDACEELAEARCDCDESMCDDSEANVDADDKRTQACKEELESFACEAE